MEWIAGLFSASALLCLLGCVFLGAGCAMVSRQRSRSTRRGTTAPSIDAASTPGAS